jgi:hypothetical protein
VTIYFPILTIRFHPVHKSMKHKPYEKLLSTTSQFGPINYGTKCFREDVKEEDLPNGVIIINKNEKIKN